MKSTGIVRKIDDLGRIVLPIELRRLFDINKEDPVEIFVDDEYIILRKHQSSCIFCGSTEDVKDVKGKMVCSKCIEEISNQK